MGRLGDEHDQPHSERGERNFKVGFKGFDWWINMRSWAIPFAFSLNEGWGPMGYENGFWVMRMLHIQILCFGCRLEFITSWTPNDEADPIPRLGKRAPRRTRVGQSSTGE